MTSSPHLSCFFFFNDTATTEIYTSFPTRRSSDLKRQSQIRVALVRGVVHGHQQALSAGPLPRKRHQALRGRVALPGGRRVDQPPLTAPQQRTTEDGEQLLIELAQRLVHRLVRGPAQMA